MTDDADHGPSTPLSSSGPRRQRAPTITINTSANEESEEPTTLPGETSPTDVRPSHSFDSYRPVSPHNVSSPTSKWANQKPHNFLAVPSTHSRVNSVDSDEPGHSPTTDGAETSVSSLSSTTVNKVTGDPINNDYIIDDQDALKADPGTESDFRVEDNKFAFTPGQLSKLFNPKSHAAFHAVGGLRGLEKGLRTDRFAGLSLDEKQLDGTVSFDQAVAAGLDKDPDDFERRLMLRQTTSIGAAGRRNSDDAFYDRKRIFTMNHLPEKKAKSIFQLAWIAYNDKVLILLTVAAVISLALGIYQSVTAKDGEAPVEWVEGVAIMVAIIIVVVTGAVNDWQKERQFVKLNKKKDDRNVKVIRSAKSREISVHDLLVGDVMHMEPGDMLPVDGIFISGHNVKCDESSATGESDLLRKTAADEVHSAIEAHQNVAKLDPFIISGGKVSEGIGTFLVTGVGVNSSFGKMMISLQDEPQTTPLQSKLNVLAEYIAKLGLGAGLVLFLATFIKFIVNIAGPGKGLTPDLKGQEFLNVFIVAVTIVVVAVPEGLPLAVTLALAFATTRMLKDNNLVRLLRACETMGNATTICSDKTGTLTQNKMSTVAGILSVTARFGDKKVPDTPDSCISDSPSKGKQLAPESPVDSKDDTINTSPDKRKASIFDTIPDSSMVNFVNALNSDVKEVLKMSIAVNSTAFEGEDDGGQFSFIGSKTETALLSFARDHLAMESVNEERANANVVQMVPFDSGRKCMAVVVKFEERKYRMLVKGASEILLGTCSNILQDPNQSLTARKMTSDDMDTLTDVIDAYASRSLRTIGLLYRDFEQWPPPGTPTQEEDAKLAVFEKVFKNMTFLGIVGIQDPLRAGVAEAVRRCQDAGVFVRMVTGDNVLTAKAIAEECGIYDPKNGEVMEGPEFRKLGSRDMNQIIPRLQVLARSSPDDKRILVKRLKELGETVAVTGDGTNDAPALKTADVGFSMGIAGTEVAKEASAIILMDDNFASIVKAIMWGRAVNDSVKKFLQFQLTVNITAVVLTFVSAVASDTETSVLSAVQLLWVNLIMDTFAALALATDPPTESILDRPPEPKSAPLITTTMWKMIVGQSIYQLVVTFILYFAGDTILSYQSDREMMQLGTLVFNTFVWMQIFNQYNNRRLDNRMNIFEGITRNYFFIGIQFIIVAGQVMIVFVGGRAFAVHRLNTAQWLYSFVLGLLSIPVGSIIRLIPDKAVRKLIPRWFVRKAAPKVFVEDEERQYEWNAALEEIREELTFIKKLRGGRLSALRYKLQHPDLLLPRPLSTSSRSRSRTNSLPTTPTGEATGAEGDPKLLATPESRKSSSRHRIGRSRSNSAFSPSLAMAGVIAGSVAGWSPIGKRDEEGTANYSPPDKRSQAEELGNGTMPANNPSINAIASSQAESSHTTYSPRSDTPSTPHPAPSLLTPPPRG